jgi:hypothetical protein
MDAAGVITGQVPNSLLQKASRITVYICTYEGSAFKTLYKLEIPVRSRPMPSDYTFEDDAGEIYSFNALETQVANALTAAAEAKSNYTAAAQKETTTEKALATATAAQTDAAQKYTAALEALNGVQDGTLFLKKAGDEMAGNINMNGHTVTALADPVNETDAVPKSFFNLPKLWENSEEAMGTELINLDLSAYRFIAILGEGWVGAGGLSFSAVVPVNASAALRADHVYEGVNYEDERYIEEWHILERRVGVTPEGVRFSNSRRLQVYPADIDAEGAAEYGNTKIMVPMEIYGIK